MNITEQYKHIFEPELIKEMEALATHTSVKANETILDFGQVVRVMPVSYTHLTLPTSDLV